MRLAAYWKCTELVTNFRFDYSYIGSNLPPSSRPCPSLTQMTVCVPVNGGVRNTLSRPSGNWVADKQQITWKIGEVPSGSSDSESYNFPRMLFMLRRLLINLYNHNYVRVSVQSRNASF